MRELNNKLNEIDELRAKLSELRPLSKEQLQKLEDAFFIEYTYESNRIEGNTLTLQETSLVIQKGITIAGKPLREHLEAVNHFEAVYLIKDITDRKESFNERILKDIHALILRGIDKENAGRYHNVNVKISGSRYIPPDALKVQELMDNYFAFYNDNKDKLHPVILSAHMHEKLVTVHPFIDGNGRAARLVMNLILLQSGYTMVNIAGDGNSRVAYYNALEKCQVENIFDDFLLLIAEEEIRSLRSYLSIVKTGNL